jgi:hypothetical protein
VAANETDRYELMKAEAMLVGYDARWNDAMSGYTVLAVEAEFRTALVNPMTRAASRTWRLAGKLDVVLHENATRRDGFMEHKSATGDVGPGSDYVKRLKLDGQVSIYFDGARALGLEPQFCLYDVLAKPAQRPLRATPPESRRYTKAGKLDARQREQDETPEEYFARVAAAIAEDPGAYYQRAEVVRLEAEISEAAFDVWQIGRQLREAEIAGRYPRNPDACVRYGQTCPFFDVCCGTASLDDPARFRRTSRLHPELTQRTEDLEHMTGGSNLLSASRLATARACQRLHKFKYVDGYQPAADADTLRFGSLIHRGLEAWWRAPAGERLEAALAALHSPAPAAQPELADASA